MTKIYYIAVMVMVAACLTAQDLIERSKLGLPKEVTEINRVADQMVKKNDLPQISPFQYISTKTSHSDIIRLSLDIATIGALQKKKEVEMIVPVGPEQQFSLKLYPVDITAPGYILTDERGDIIEAQTPISYRGIVSDDPASVASVTVIDDALRILISDDHGNYNLGMPDNGEHYILYNDIEAGPIPYSCLNDEESVEVAAQEKQIKVSHDKAGECVKVYVEADYQSYINKGRSASTVQDFILGAFAEVAILYENIGVPIEVSQVKVWTSDDPYGAESNVSGALNYLAANVNSFNGDLFHLVSIRNANSFSGIGYLSCRGSGPCKATTIGTNVPFAVSQTSMNYSQYPNYSWTVAVLAHEMGHTMGAPHTHACVWGPNDNRAIDGCVAPNGCTNPGNPTIGTLMSYCHLTGVGISFAQGFGNEVGTHIYDEYVYASSRYLSGCSSSEPIDVPGCMNPNDHNYNPNATVDDGSCQGTCSDGIQNGDETGVDCGGAMCPDCPVDYCQTVTPINNDWSTTFEGNIGSWSQDGDDDIDWSINSGGTGSSNTGPSGAIQGSRYIYVEASQPNYPSKTAILRSPCINVSGLNAPMLSMDYHMYGSNMGTLQVDIIRNDQRQTIWSRSGDQGNQWNAFSYNLNGYQSSDFYIEILATTGDNFRSDIAIDYVRITQEQVTCDDGIQNGDETGVDCGGSSCQPCFDCDRNSYTINSNMTIRTDETSIVRDDINANGNITVNGNADLFWQAGRNISINGEFEVKAGASVILATDECAN